jgi:hypothetical protein
MTFILLVSLSFICIFNYEKQVVKVTKYYTMTGNQSSIASRKGCCWATDRQTLVLGKTYASRHRRNVESGIFYKFRAYSV